MNDKVRQARVRTKKSNVALDTNDPQEEGGYVSVMRDEMVAKLEEVDKMIREEIRREVDSAKHGVSASSRLACLLRTRVDVQSAITCLLGASH